jgi:glycosyltransferase involved in cell wall biosynthesis
MKLSISIVTVSFNAAASIGDTLASVARQTNVEFEHVVVDGGSRDATMAVVRRHEHDRLFAKSERDAGIYDAMNKGVARATGDYVLFLNADDYLARPDALALAAAKLTETPVDCLLADTRFVGSDGRTPQHRLYSARRFAPWWLRVGMQPPHPSMLMRRTLIRDLGGFDTSYRIAGDFDLIARAVLREQASFTRLPIVLTHFRVGGMSTAGMQSKLILNRELSRSLTALGQRFGRVAVMGRIPLKLLQLRPPFVQQHYQADWLSDPVPMRPVPNQD